MDWFHCNFCYKQLESEEEVQNFVLTNCGHIFCGACAENVVSSGKCSQCSHSCRAMRINGELPADVGVFLRNTEYHVRRAVAAQKEASLHLTNYMKAEGFQQGQREHLKSRQKQTTESSTRTVTKEEFQKLQKDRATDAETIARLQKQLADLTSTIRKSRSTEVHAQKVLNGVPISAQVAGASIVNSGSETRSKHSGNSGKMHALPCDQHHVYESRNATRVVTAVGHVHAVHGSSRAHVVKTPGLGVKTVSFQTLPASGRHTSAAKSNVSGGTHTSSRIIPGPTYQQPLVVKRYKM